MAFWREKGRRERWLRKGKLWLCFHVEKVLVGLRDKKPTDCLQVGLLKESGTIIQEFSQNNIINTILSWKILNLTKDLAGFDR